MKIIFKTTQVKVDIYYAYLKEILNKTLNLILIVFIFSIYIYYSGSSIFEFFNLFILLIIFHLISIIKPLLKVCIDKDYKKLASLSYQKIDIPNFGTYIEEEIKAFIYLSDEEGINISMDLHSGSKILIFKYISKKEALAVHKQLQLFLNVSNIYRRDRGLLVTKEYTSIHHL